MALEKKAAKKIADPAARPKRVAAPGKAVAPRKSAAKDGSEKHYALRLYVAGQTNKSIVALNNLQKICETYLQGRYTITVIDLLKNPQLAKGHQILAIPTLVREVPEPLRKIIGDLSKTDRVLVGLDIQPNP